MLPTNLHENFTTTTWDKPEARDNLGTPTIEASLSAAKERFYLDEVTVVTYTARDRAGLESTCTFSITVTGISFKHKAFKILQLFLADDAEKSCRSLFTKN